MQHGSPLLQTALFSAAILFLLCGIWRGWRAGLARSGLCFGGLLVSLSIGCLTAKLIAVPLGGLNSPAGFLGGALVGGALGIFLFVAIWIVGAVLFKRTKHQAGIFRIFWGAGGAFFGLLLGLAMLWGGILGIRAFGTFAESRAEAEPRLTGLVALKESLELGSAGRFLEAVDPLPADFYEVIVQIGRVTADQEARLRFLDYPEIRQIRRNARIIELMNDPGVIQASTERNFFLLLNNKAVAAALTDRKLAEQLNQVDLRAALKFALESPQAPSSPSQSSLPALRQ
jgi:hypothetical protein